MKLPGLFFVKKKKKSDNVVKPGCATEDVGVPGGQKKTTKDLDPFCLAVGEMSIEILEELLLEPLQAHFQSQHELRTSTQCTERVQVSLMLFSFSRL